MALWRRPYLGPSRYRLYSCATGSASSFTYKLLLIDCYSCWRLLSTFSIDRNKYPTELVRASIRQRPRGLSLACQTGITPYASSRAGLIWRVRCRPCSGFYSVGWIKAALNESSLGQTGQLAHIRLLESVGPDLRATKNNRVRGILSYMKTILELLLF